MQDASRHSDYFLYIMYNFSLSQAASTDIATISQTLLGSLVNENIVFGCLTGQEFMDKHATNLSILFYYTTQS